MSRDVDLYDTYYSHLAAIAQTEVRRDTYDEDLGQSSWITLAEAREWFRLLRLDAGSRALEVGSIGFCLFVPAGGNERLLERAGFIVEQPRDVTDAEATVSARWRDARARRREALAAVEGQEAFDAIQRFLDAVCTLSRERRLSRFAYLAHKPA